ncbi:MAG: hypothetical protein A2Y76_04255 [Planctomycetes bacterium RBG_13_60_9]|nr:MAG: hypothetical protein A2Y76_04255 [Planctomycetes bacterium RBG_13_60_9]
MAITNITVSNFKSFQHLDLDLGPFNVLVGANASARKKVGKTITGTIKIDKHGQRVTPRVDDRVCRKLGVRILRRTDEVTKEQFSGLMPRRFNSVVEFMTEILRRFRVETAKGRNRSFRYLMDKLGARSKKV